MDRYKILIVDDEQGIVTMLKDYFQFHGYLGRTISSILLFVCFFL